MILLSGCVTRVYSDCPAWPVAGDAVADELETLPEKDYPATWEWLGRLAKFKEKLDVQK